MLEVRLQHPVTGDAPPFEPCPAVAITGERLTVGGAEVATHHNGQWHHGGRHFTAILLDSAAVVHFEDDGGKASPVYGPFNRVRIVDGSIRAGDGFRDVLARLDERSKHWEVYGEPGEWLRAVFRPPGPAGG